MDGKAVEPVKALGSVVAFYVEGDAGQTHEISMVYRPNVLVVGGLISLTSCGLYLLLVATYPKIKNVPVLQSLVTIPDNEQKKKPRRKKDQPQCSTISTEA